MSMFIDESSFASKLLLQKRISKINKQKGVEISGGNKGIKNLIKNHYNPGLRQIINTSNDIDELQYIRKDTRTVFHALEKIKERINLCKSEGETRKTSSYYKFIKSNYIDEGITEKDVQKTIDELNKDMNTISVRIKELRKTQNESFEIFIDSDLNLLEIVDMEQLFK